MVATLSLSRGVPPAVPVSLPVPLPESLPLSGALPRREFSLWILRLYSKAPKGRKDVARGVSPWTAARHPISRILPPCAAATPGGARGCGGARGRLEYYFDLLILDSQGLTPLATSLRPHSGAQIGLEEQPLRAQVRSDNRLRCRPAESKFPGSSHASNARRRVGHSVSMIEYHAVSRLRPL